MSFRNLLTGAPVGFYRPLDAISPFNRDVIQCLDMNWDCVRTSTVSSRFQRPGRAPRSVGARRHQYPGDGSIRCLTLINPRRSRWPRKKTLPKTLSTSPGQGADLPVGVWAERRGRGVDWCSAQSRTRLSTEMTVDSRLSVNALRIAILTSLNCVMRNSCHDSCFRYFHGIVYIAMIIVMLFDNFRYDIAF